MATLAWAHAGDVDARPDAVYAWMSDFRPDDHATAAFLRGAGAAGPQATRKVLRRSDHEVVLEDTWKGRRFELTAKLDPQAREVRVQGAMGYHAVKALRKRGWKPKDGPFEIPDGPCFTFEDPTGNPYAVVGNVRPDALQREAAAARE
jgi:hypothetical protein